MAKKTPQKKDFEQAEHWDKRNRACIWLIEVLSIAVVVIDYFKWEFTELKNTIILIIFLVTVINICCKWNFDRCFRLAEETRRCGFLDNAFNTKLTCLESDGYYDTEEVKLGFRRFLANLHENCLYSNRISEQMLKHTGKKILCIGIFFLVITISNFFEMEIAVAIAGVIITTGTFDDYYRLKSFTDETDAVLKECESLWSVYAERYNNPDNRTMALIMKAYSRYEANLANKTIMLDSDIFNKINEDLKKEWESIKKRYNI